MIGQSKNIRTIIQWRLNKSIPRFIIIEGDEGSGRLTLAKIIGRVVGNSVLCEDNSKDTVKKVIKSAYNVINPAAYIFRDIDDMSNAGKASLLKVVEEPPNRAYFIMTIKDASNLIGTLWSRAVKLKMEPYAPSELLQFCRHDDVLKYASTVGQVLTWDNKDIKVAEQSVKDCFDALNNRKCTQLLLATSQLRSKISDETKLDCDLFMRVFNRNMPDSGICGDFIFEPIEKCKKQLKTGSLNKKASIEIMLLSILQELKNADISETVGRQDKD